MEYIPGVGPTTERFDTVNFVPELETVDQLEKFGTEVIPAALELAELRAGR